MEDYPQILARPICLHGIGIPTASMKDFFVNYGTSQN
jgi:hypothetical protein